MLEEPVGVSIILFLVIKELLSHLRNQRGDERRKPVSEELDTTLRSSIIPIMNQQVLILNELKELSMQGHDSHINIQNDISILKDNDERMRVNLHSINDMLHTRPQ